jgi:hypothetical protein
MDNLSPLADRYAALKVQAEVIKKELESLRVEILSTGYEVIVGEKCFVKVCLSEPERFNSELAKKFLTEEQIRECMKKSLVETLRISPKL